MLRFLILLALLVSLNLAARAQDKSVRAQLLYATHCVACHDDKIHWRSNKHVTNWPSLKSEVQRWEGVLDLAWGDEDIEGVAKYLNALYYHFETADLLVRQSLQQN